MRSKDKSSENSLLSRKNFGGSTTFIVARCSRNLGVKPYYQVLTTKLIPYIDYITAHTFNVCMSNNVINIKI